MKLIKFKIKPIDSEHSLATLAVSDGDPADPKTEFLHIRMGISHHANPLVSELQIKVLQRARDVIGEQMKVLRELPHHPDIS